MENNEDRIDKVVNDNIEFCGGFKRYLFDNDKEYRDKVIADFKRQARKTKRTATDKNKITKRGKLTLKRFK